MLLESKIEGHLNKQRGNNIAVISHALNHSFMFGLSVTTKQHSLPK